MCGRFDLTAPISELLDEFGGVPLHDIQPCYNVAPSQNILAIRYETGLGRVWRRFRWGLIPHWAEDEKIGYKMINARAETINEKPSFQESFQSRRCLIPATGFFEWKGEKKQPFRIARKDGKPFGFAGIHTFWLAPDGGVIESCAIITTKPNKVMVPIHDRMPVILAPDEYDTWLNPGNYDSVQLKSFLKPCPAVWLKAYPVSKTVNSSKNDVPACIEPVDA